MDLMMMTRSTHQGMRTTLSVDDDVAAQLKVEGRLSGRPFREIVNETLRAVWRSAHHGPPRLHRDRAAARFPLRADAYRELGHVRRRGVRPEEHLLPGASRARGVPPRNAVAGGLREAFPRQPPRVCPPRVGGPVPYAPLAGHDPGQAGPPAEVLGSAVFT